jgi:hypothetical protein
MRPTTIKFGLIAAGLVNILGVLIFSRFFTNEWINKADPIVMSTFGLIMIIVWGFAYISIAKGFENVKWVLAVFAVEKLIYGLIWINWIFYQDIRILYKNDLMAGMFYSIYGLFDLVFMVFFTIAFFSIEDKEIK